MMVPRHGEHGAVLAGALCIAAAVLVLAAGWFEMSTARLRRAAGFADRIRAFHAADAALEACTALLVKREAAQAEGASDYATADASRESSGDVLHPFARWPGLAEPPACRIEALDSPDTVTRFYLVTAHAGGMDGSPPLWLQQQMSMVSGRVMERRWRELAGQPR